MPGETLEKFKIRLIKYFIALLTPIYTQTPIYSHKTNKQKIFLESYANSLKIYIVWNRKLLQYKLGYITHFDLLILHFYLKLTIEYLYHIPVMNSEQQ
jgi:hypothetical protein